MYQTDGKHVVVKNSDGGFSSIRKHCSTKAKHMYYKRRKALGSAFKDRGMLT
jgi:hypothetical protein